MLSEKYYGFETESKQLKEEDKCLGCKSVVIKNSIVHHNEYNEFLCPTCFITLKNFTNNGVI